MLKALEVGSAELMFDFFKFHQELLYHPHTSVTEAYLNYFET